MLSRHRILKLRCISGNKWDMTPKPLMESSFLTVSSGSLMNYKILLMESIPNFDIGMRLPHLMKFANFMKDKKYYFTWFSSIIWVLISWLLSEILLDRKLWLDYDAKGDTNSKSQGGISLFIVIKCQSAGDSSSLDIQFITIIELITERSESDVMSQVSWIKTYFKLFCRILPKKKETTNIYRTTVLKSNNSGVVMTRNDKHNSWLVGMTTLLVPKLYIDSSYAYLSSSSSEIL